MATHIKELLNLVIHENKHWHVQLLKAWPDIVGSLKAHIQLVKIYQDTLIIGVPDACWMHELFLLSNVLIAAINKKLDQPRIKQVRFKTVMVRQHTEKKETLMHYKQEVTVRLNPMQQRALNKIEDQELQGLLQSYLMRCKREQS